MSEAEMQKVIKNYENTLVKVLAEWKGSKSELERALSDASRDPNHLPDNKEIQGRRKRGLKAIKACKDGAELLASYNKYLDYILCVSTKYF